MSITLTKNHPCAIKLKIALAQSKSDRERGKYVVESVIDHIKRICKNKKTSLPE